MKNSDIKMIIENFNNSRKVIFSQNRYVLFSPALVLMLLGVAVVLMPKFFLFVIATFFLTLGIALAVIIWKVIQFKQRVDSMVKEFNGKVVVQGLHVIDPNRRQSAKDIFSEDLTTVEVDQNDSKKIIFH